MSRFASTAVRFVFLAAACSTASLALAQATGPLTPEALALPGASPRAVAVGDFDHDGRLDLAAQAWAGYSPVNGLVRTYLSRGQGLFASANELTVPGSDPRGMVASDFDSDLDLDLVVTDGGGATLRLLAGDGAGAFALGASVSMPFAPGALAVADLDHDASPDVAVVSSASGSTRLMIVLNDGSGGFLAPASFVTGDQPVDVAIGDLDGDTHADVAVARSLGGVELFHGDGAGGYTTWQTFLAPNAFSRSVLLSDLDHDSDLDLVFSHTNGSKLEVRLNDGAGNFGAAGFALGAQAYNLMAADVDDDGDVDLCGSVYNSSLAAWLNNGSGSFSGAVKSGAGCSNAVAGGDLDGDGVFDLASTKQELPSLVVFPGDGTGRFGGAAVALSKGVSQMVHADLDHDGDEDLVLRSTSTAELLVALHATDGSYVTSVVALPAQAHKLVGGFFDAGTDFDVATLTTSGTCYVLLGNGSGGFAAPVTSVLSVQPIAAQCGDVTGDGLDDLALAGDQWPTLLSWLRVYPSNGSGGFGTAIQLPLPYPTYYTRRIAIGRLNGDAQEDVVFTTGSAYSIVLVSTGSSGFTSTTIAPGTSVEIADVDADGDGDVVMAGSSVSPGQLELYLGDGSGALASPLSFPTECVADHVAVGDFDDDGDVDLACVDECEQVELVVGDGAGGFAALPTRFASRCVQVADVVASDADHDGRTDLLLTDGSLAELVVLRQQNAWEHPDAYCTAKTNSLGCVPSIGSSGVPSASQTSGFTVSASSVINNKIGLLFYSFHGRNDVPFQGGRLCVKAPSARTPLRDSGGNPPPNDCSGVFALDLNAYAHGLAGGNPKPELLVVGTAVTAQWWGRDAGTASGTTLSDAIEWLVGP